MLQISAFINATRMQQRERTKENAGFRKTIDKKFVVGKESRNQKRISQARSVRKFIRIEYMAVFR